MRRPSRPAIALVTLWLLTSVSARAEEPARYPGDSLYQLRPALTDQAGAATSLDRYAGHPVLVSMFYASCPNVCPALVGTLQSIERAVPESERTRLRVLLVSFDDQLDTPAKLTEVATRQHVDASRWTLARADASDVRLLAAALGIQYRRLADGGFNHATVITLLDERGVPRARTSQLGGVDPALPEALAKLAR